MTCDEETQFRFAGFMQAEVERYLDTLPTAINDVPDGSDRSQASDDDDREASPSPAKAKAAKAAPPNSKASSEPVTKSLQQLASDHAFLELAGVYTSALSLGVLDVRHSAVLLAYYGRFGTIFDEFSQRLGETLKDEGLYANNTAVVVTVVLVALRDVSSYSSSCRVESDVYSGTRAVYRQPGSRRVLPTGASTFLHV